mmetsp:Transcript_30325/g.44620  ORF Transcript_30325/g.44620 Transcript_30325/m.44620 type:complete len:271 (-) Transcript_30325:201-1013(-)
MPTLHLPNLQRHHSANSTAEEEDEELVPTTATIWKMMVALVDRMVTCVEQMSNTEKNNNSGVGMEIVYTLHQHLHLCCAKAKTNTDNDEDARVLLQKMKRMVQQHRQRTAERRTAMTRGNLALQTFAPNVSATNTKHQTQSSAKDKKEQQRKLQREYKREHKAVQRELRTDAAMIEEERRLTKQRRDDKERTKSHKNFAWMEVAEQATMDQQQKSRGARTLAPSKSSQSSYHPSTYRHRTTKHGWMHPLETSEVEPPSGTWRRLVSPIIV